MSIPKHVAVVNRTTRQPLVNRPIGRGISAQNTPQTRTAPAVVNSNQRAPSQNPHARYR